MSLAAGKNSAPRARRPQPRCNVGQAAEQRRHGHPPGASPVRLRPTRPKRLKQLAGRQNSTPCHPSRKFQSTEGQQKTAFPGSRLPPPPLPGGAGRDCPPARNCPRRLAPVGPDSTLPVLKKRFLSLRQCRMANVAALSGLTVAWRRVFRAAGQDCPADTGGRAFE